MIIPGGKLWTVNMVESSGSHSLDAAGSAAKIMGIGRATLYGALQREAA